MYAWLSVLSIFAAGSKGSSELPASDSEIRSPKQNMITGFSLCVPGMLFSLIHIRVMPPLHARMASHTKVIAVNMSEVNGLLVAILPDGLSITRQQAVFYANTNANGRRLPAYPPLPHGGPNGRPNRC